jgi:hypothetical protein
VAVDLARKYVCEYVGVDGMMVMICFYEALRHWGCFWLWCLLGF